MRRAFGTALGLALAAAVLRPGAGLAAANCTARILADVPALEAPEQVKSKRSATFGPVTQIKVAKQTGKMFFCAAQSYCYDSNAFEFTTACRIKLDKAKMSGDYFIYFTR